MGTTPSNRDFTDAAGSVVERAEAVQHGAERQSGSTGTNCDGACRADAFAASMEAMESSFDMPCIDAPLEGRQQFMREWPSAQTMRPQVMAASAG